LVAASHFFVGLGAGIAILAVPVLTLTPGAELPQRLVAWIDGPSPHATEVRTEDAAISRPVRGYRPGDPTPAPEAPPTLRPAVVPTSAARIQPSIPQPLPPGASMRTGVIRAGGQAVFVRRVAGVESPDDPMIADGSPVLVSAGGALQVGDQAWRAVRGLNGIAGWVPSTQVVVDGESPQQLVAASSATPVPTGPGPDRAMIANTDGAGVVLRNSPNDGDRRPAGFLDGTNVTILERSGTDWVRVRADNGQQGWIPSRYLAAVN
jgi:SH3-like domain-containing protein